MLVALTRLSVRAVPRVPATSLVGRSWRVTDARDHGFTDIGDVNLPFPAYRRGREGLPR